MHNLKVRNIKVHYKYTIRMKLTRLQSLLQNSELKPDITVTWIYIDLNGDILRVSKRNCRERFLRSRWVARKHSRTASIDYFNVFTVKQRGKILALSDSGNLALLGTGLFSWSNQSLFSSSSPLSLLPSFLRPSVPHPFCLFPSCLISN